MTQHGVYANRNAGHKARQARLYALAKNDRERLAAACNWFRSSAELLARRRPPEGTDQEVHRMTAARLIREAAEHMKALAAEIDRGEYDVQRR
jgi:hypothetical protein